MGSNWYIFLLKWVKNLKLVEIDKLGFTNEKNIPQGIITWDTLQGNIS